MRPSMTEDVLPSGDTKYSFKAHMQARGFAGDFIISSTTVNDLVKSIKLLERANITPTAPFGYKHSTGIVHA